nr:reverse transcriptase domain-containing protein [Tanacetum cinerariifolium]
MAPKKTTKANPTTTITTTTTSVTDAQLEELIEQGIAKALVARDADRNMNGDDNHVSRTCARRTKRVTYMKKKMTDKYCPRGEMKKLENKIKRYVGGLPDLIHGIVVASRPKTMQEANEMANELMDKRNNTWAEHQAEKKRKVDETSRSNQSQQQQQNKRQNTGMAYTARSYLVKRNRTEGLNLCALSVTITTLVHVPRNATSVTRLATLLVIVGVQQMKDCLKFKNNNRGTHGGNAIAPTKGYAVGRVGTNPDSNVVTGNEILIVHGDGSDQGNETRLNIISCAKTQKYIQKGCHLFLAHITTKETEDKSEKKRLEDVPIVRNFPEVFPKVFPEDFLGLPLTRQVEFQIDLILSVAPVARAPYRLAPFEMKELSEQL